MTRFSIIGIEDEIDSSDDSEVEIEMNNDNDSDYDESEDSFDTCYSEQEFYDM